MYSRRWISPLVGLFLIAFVLGTARAAHANVLARSGFETDAEGWTVKDMPFPTPGAPPTILGTFVPAYHVAGGNPDGFVSLLDPTGNTWYWSAPAKFLGNKQGAYGGALSFDLAVTGTGAPFAEEDVILVGGGLTLVLALPSRPNTTFTSYRVGLTETGWKRTSLAGVAATRADMIAVLGNLTAIYIRGEYLLNMDDVGSLDNVVLEGSGAQCDIQLNQTTFVNGDPITAQVFRFGNSEAVEIAVELKVWLEIPGVAPLPLLRAGADGSVSFPAGMNTNLGPATLFTVTPAFPRGNYAFSCRLVDPVTGATLVEDLNPFVVQ